MFIRLGSGIKVFPNDQKNIFKKIIRRFDFQRLTEYQYFLPSESQIYLKLHCIIRTINHSVDMCPDVVGYH